MHSFRHRVIGKVLERRLKDVVFAYSYDGRSSFYEVAPQKRTRDAVSAVVTFDFMRFIFCTLGTSYTNTNMFQSRIPYHETGSFKSRRT